MKFHKSFISSLYDKYEKRTLPQFWLSCIHPKFLFWSFFNQCRKKIAALIFFQRRHNFVLFHIKRKRNFSFWKLHHFEIRSPYKLPMHLTFAKWIISGSSIKIVYHLFQFKIPGWETWILHFLQAILCLIPIV